MDKQIKTCPKCLLDKPFNEFYIRKDRDDRPSSWCKQCVRKSANEWYEVPHNRLIAIKRSSKRIRSKPRDRDRWLMNQYGITSDQFETMLEKQGGKCNICQSDNPRGNGNFHVDHDHNTGEIRGALCHLCNVNLSSVDSVSDKIGYLIQVSNHLGLNNFELALRLLEEE